MLYFAYGSNLNINQMSKRCPAAEPLHLCELPGWQITFRGVLDIERKQDAAAMGVIWRVTENCLVALDRYEGVKSGFYERIHFRVRLPGARRSRQIISYRMCRNGYVAPPNEFYYNAVKEGYEDFGLPMQSLHDALARSKATRK